ncbi:MAG: ATP-dependent helicase [Methylococcales symbiont of Iophon sp. n. MRB-2018]|nr:MAG: ATP-dependent helicase [Methylococcales symbiont of Iophon sp. n. MRB-2018]KAF3979343.1 MAG: ATP-dependent helicase [Methylococcales symbiont of Iophon sp. n. MRB-2018]
MSSAIELSSKQKSIVDADAGAIYVKASAGSGKTRVLTERVRYLLSQTDKKILALTFTNKAGEEIKERLEDVENISARTFIGTFHSFCQSILEMRIHLLGYDEMPHIFENESDRLELIEKSIHQIPSYSATYNKKNTKEKRSFSYRALNFIAGVKRQLISESDIENHTEDKNIVLLYRTYQDTLRAQNAIDYDDLLLLAYNIFIEFPKVAALYRRSFYAICIDEAQDMNNAQYQFLKYLTNGELTNVMMVGDPNQAIYHFNGSSSDYMNKEFVKDFSPKTIELTENFRSSRAVLQAANKLIPEMENIEGLVKEGVFKRYKAENEEKEAEWVVSKIQKFICLKNHSDIEGDITLEKIAVLARNKYLFKTIEKILKQLNIPYCYKMTPGALQFESKIMQIFDLALKVKLNQDDDLHLQRLLKLLSLSTDNKIDLPTIIERLKNESHKKIIVLVNSLNESGDNFFKQMSDFKEQIMETDDEEKRMLWADIEELLKHWQIYAKNTDNKSLHQFKNAMALGKIHPLSEHNGLTLSTVHTMKGQEFEIVFIIGLDDETFPDYRAVKSGGVDLIQEKNNLYVAFTRSKRWLYISYPRERTMPWGGTKTREISRFLTGFDCKIIKENKGE